MEKRECILNMHILGYKINVVVVRLVPGDLPSIYTSLHRESIDSLIIVVFALQMTSKWAHDTHWILLFGTSLSEPYIAHV